MKTVLILTQRFFPDPVTGAVRMTQWARTLPRYGWRPIIACQNQGFSVEQDELSRLIHPEAQVIYLNEPSPGRPEHHGHRGIKSAAAQVFGMGIVGRSPRNPLLRGLKKIFTDFVARRKRRADETFWRTSTSKVADLVRLYSPDAVITSSPPVELHGMGMSLKQDFPRLGWLADFRDDYRQGGRYRVGPFQALRSRHELQSEAAIYATADAIACAIPTQQRWIRRRFPEQASKAFVVLNGVPDELIGGTSPPAPHASDALVKVIGFSDAPESVLLARAVAGVRESGYPIGLRIVGRLPTVQREIQQALSGNVTFAGAMRHDLAVAEMMSAKVLVAVLSENRSRVFGISSKLFEYLAVPVPVIVINPTRPDRRLFARFPGVWMLTKPTVADLEAALVSALGSPLEPIRTRAVQVQERWSRDSQVAQVAAILDGLVLRRSAGEHAWAFSGATDTR